MTDRLDFKERTVFDFNKRTAIYNCNNIITYLDEQLSNAQEDEIDIIIHQLEGLIRTSNYLILNIDSDRYDNTTILDYLCDFDKYLKKYPNESMKIKANQVFNHCFDCMDISFKVTDFLTQ